MNILLVDDEEQILQVIGDFLADCGYESTSAGDGAEALKVLEERNDIGLVVSDIRMPRMNGIEFLKAARVRFPGIPVILLTGHGDEHLAITALQEGAQDYLKKPIKFEAFLGCIEQVEERNRLEAQILEDYQSLLRTGETAEEKGEQKDSEHKIRDSVATALDDLQSLDRLWSNLRTHLPSGGPTTPSELTKLNFILDEIPSLTASMHRELDRIAHIVDICDQTGGELAGLESQHKSA